MEKKLITLEDCYKEIQNNPFTFTGEEYLIVPKHLVESSFLDGVSNYSEINIKNLGEKRKIKRLSDINFGLVEILHHNLDQMRNVNLSGLILSEVKNMSGLSQIGFLYNSKIETMLGLSRVGKMDETSEIENELNGYLLTKIENEYLRKVVKGFSDPLILNL